MAVKGHDYSDKAREAAAKEGKAMPDGSYPTRDRAEFADAVLAIGRAGPHRAAVMAYLKRRARAEGWTSLLPDSWR
jgi:hypothetical protein